MAATVMAAAIGALAALAGQLFFRGDRIQISGALLVSGVAVVYAVSEVTGLRVPVPTRHWLVPRRWGELDDRVYAILFGLNLGTGFMTVVSFVGGYLLLLACGLMGDVQVAAPVYSVYGFSRALPLVLTAFAFDTGSESPGAPFAVVEGHLEANRSVVRWLRVASLISIAVVAPSLAA